MAWKVERWLSDVFPGPDNVYGEYRSLRGRELVIVAAAVIDAALAELLRARLMPYDKEAEDFLGASGDGRAPAASLGSRIQLALLLGVLLPHDVEVLRAMKNLRNTFAHRVKASFLTEPARSQTHQLFTAWRSVTKRLVERGVLQGDVGALDEIEVYIDQIDEAGEGLTLAVLATYQAYFHLLHARITRIQVVT